MNKKTITFFLVLCITLFFCSAKTLVIMGYPRDYNLDPHTANYSSDAQVLNGLYEGLFTLNPATAEPEVAVAKSFKISRNRKIWTFYLYPDITFSDGTPLTAEDVRRSLITELSPKTHAPYASLLSCIEGADDYRMGKTDADSVKIHVRNETTVVITLNEPTAHFANILANVAFSVVPEKEGVYSGAYTLESKIPTKTVLVKNKNYHDAQNVKIDRIEFQGTDDTVEATWALNTGKAQWLSGIFSPELLCNKNMLIISAQFGTEFMFFRDNRKPWTDPALRNAILTAIPWPDLRTGNIVAATSLILPLQNYPDIIGLTDYDPDLAKEMFAEAGYTEKDNLTLTIAIPDYDNAKKEANSIKDGLAKIGVTVEIKLCDPDTYLDSLDTIDADVFTYTWIGDFADPLAFLELFRKDSTLRETDWTNDTFEKLIQEASALTDVTERYKKLAAAEQVLIDSGLIIPISHPVAADCIDIEILGGWYSNVLDIHPLKDLYFMKEPDYTNFVQLNRFDQNSNLCYTSGL
jgi:oligopeptide transport system substrate-binding protein